MCNGMALRPVETSIVFELFETSEVAKHYSEEHLRIFLRWLNWFLHSRLCFWSSCYHWPSWYPWWLSFIFLVLIDHTLKMVRLVVLRFPSFNLKLFLEIFFSKLPVIQSFHSLIWSKPFDLPKTCFSYSVFLAQVQIFLSQNNFKCRCKWLMTFKVPVLWIPEKNVLTLYIQFYSLKYVV